MSDFFATYPVTGTTLIFSVAFNIGCVIVFFLRGCDFQVSVTPSYERADSESVTTIHPSGVSAISSYRGTAAVDIDVRNACTTQPHLTHSQVHVWGSDGSYEQRSFSRPAVKGGPWRQGRDGNEAA